jgi:hypothetical protein
MLDREHYGLWVLCFILMCSSERIEFLIAYPFGISMIYFLLCLGAV